mgnify:CR=1 FL=1
MACNSSYPCGGDCNVCSASKFVCVEPESSPKFSAGDVAGIAIGSGLGLMLVAGVCAIVCFPKGSGGGYEASSVCFPSVTITIAACCRFSVGLSLVAVDSLAGSR